MIAVIDADSWVYVIGYWHRDFDDTEAVLRSCDWMIREVMTLTQADEYIGAFSTRSFRHDLYKYKEYKGNRPDKPEFIEKWGDVIKGRFRDVHEFITVPGLEADDVVIATAELLRQQGHDYIICSPDKDLRNVPGLFYVPKTGDPGEISGLLCTISEQDAYLSFWTQMLCGDVGDNVAGVPGLGPSKVQKLFEDCVDPMQYPACVKGCYEKYFGPHYGGLIYEETYQTLLMMQEEHPLYDQYRVPLSCVPNLRKPLRRERSIFEDLIG